MAKTSLEEFFQKILQTPALQNELIQSNSLEEFVRIAIKISKTYGYQFTAKELEEDLKANLYAGEDTTNDTEQEPSELSQIHSVLMAMQWAKGNSRKNKAWQAIKEALGKEK